jgi:hypothetical protein
MPQFVALAFPRGLRCPTAFSALLAMAAACGGTTRSEQETLALSPGGFEGPNFYEAQGSGGQPTPTIPSDFYEFVGDAEPVAVCSRGPAPEPVDTPMDPALRCPALSQDGLSDFTYSGGDPRNVFFGADSSVPGGTFFYPEGVLTSDVSGNDWHLSGTVDTVSGFGIFLNGCSELDASAYRGIAFNLSGRIGDGGALVFFVGTAANQIAYTWLNANRADASIADEPPNLGRCTPVALRYDGSCREARIGLTVQQELRPTRIEWQYLMQGCPEPSVNPSEITSIGWYFPQVTTGPYEVDVHLDDLRFSNEGPL